MRNDNNNPAIHVSLAGLLFWYNLSYMKSGPNNLLLRLHNNSELMGGEALDVGAGSGADAIFLAENGYSVTALDTKMENLAENTNGIKNIKVVGQNMTNFVYNESKYDLVNANNSLSFLNNAEFKNVFEKIIASLKDGGFFCFSLFGLEDDWSDRKDMSFMSYEEAVTILSQFPIQLYFQSTEKGYGKTMKNDIKFWEIHRFIVKKVS